VAKFLRTFFEKHCITPFHIVRNRVLVLENLLASLALKVQIVQRLYREAGDLRRFNVLLSAVRTIIVLFEPCVNASLAKEFLTLIAH